MNDVKVFENANFGKIRIVEINGKPYFVGIDAARVLGYKDPRQAVIQFCQDRVKHPVPDSRLNPQQTNVIPEGDLYRLIANSRLPAAKAFNRWVFDEVLPQIRKTGGYIKEKTKLPVLPPPVPAIARLTAAEREREQLIRLEHARLLKAKVLLSIARQNHTLIRDRRRLEAKAEAIITGAPWPL